MKINDKGLRLLKTFEGLRLKAYPDPGTGGDPWTIGYGHTGGDVHKDMVITVSDADNMLRRDLERFEHGVEEILFVDVNDNQFSALVCFAYNVGLNNLRNSSLLKFLNLGNSDSAADQFLKWTKAAGKELPGLVKRRNAERELFLS